jgi:hypothetical protein
VHSDYSTNCSTEESRFDSLERQQIFLLSELSRLAVLATGCEILSLLLKRPGREIDHSPLSNAEINKCEEEHFYAAIRRHGVVLNYAKSRIYLLGH